MCAVELVVIPVLAVQFQFFKKNNFRLKSSLLFKHGFALISWMFAGSSELWCGGAGRSDLCSRRGN